MVVTFHFLDYIKNIKEEPFTKSKEQLQNILEQYASLQPKPMNTQFESKVPKTDAIQRYLQKQQRVTHKYPEGIRKLSSYLGINIEQDI